METVLQSKDFDDCFTMVVSWSKNNPSPLRVRIVYDDAEFYQESFELSAIDVLAVLGDALRDVDGLLLEEVGSLLEPLRRVCGLDGESLSQSSASQEAIPASA